MEIEVNVVNAFSIGNTGGNPAGVVLDADNLSTANKQAIAANLQMSEIAFVSDSRVADFKLEFFTPVKQIPHCGHATIATFSFLKQTGKITGQRSSKETIDGPRQIVFKNDEAYMEQSHPSYHVPSENIVAILGSLDLAMTDLIPGMVPTIVNTGNSFLMVPVKNRVLLEGLKPRLEKIEELSRQYNLVGFYPFTLSSDDTGDATTRMFAPLYGIPEESATGMAAGPLACFLFRQGLEKSNMNILQGEFMDQPSRSLIRVELNVRSGVIENLFAGGRAHLAGKKRIRI